MTAARTMTTPIVIPIIGYLILPYFIELINVRDHDYSIDLPIDSVCDIKFHQARKFMILERELLLLKK